MKFTDLGDGGNSGYYQKTGEAHWKLLLKETIETAAKTDRGIYGVDDVITVTVTAPEEVDRILLQNESGSFLATQWTRTEDGVGGAVFTLTFSLGSKGSRTLNVYTEIDGERTPVTQVSFSVGEYAPTNPANEPQAQSVTGPSTGSINQPLTYTIKTNPSVSKVAFFNESGAGLAGTCSYVDEGDTRIWTYTLALGSTGTRTFSLKIKGTENVWLDTPYTIQTVLHR